MREIKFRAWDIRNSKMVENALQASETNQLITVNADYFNSPFSFFDGCKWMQFTGLKDKNGKEIYEGDILQGLYLGRYEVVFNGGEFECGRGMKYISRAIWHKSEIIGNIYETPELLTPSPIAGKEE